MGVSIDGYLMLGWEVEAYEAEGWGERQGLAEEAEARVAEILGKGEWDLGDAFPAKTYSLYYDCDWVYVGLVLLGDDSSLVDVGGYGTHLASNAELFERVARELYEAIVGHEPPDGPKLMCVTVEG